MPKQINHKFRAVKGRVLFMVAVLVVTVAASVSVVFAEIYYIGGSAGETFWLSCGSSAGNYVALCPAGGGPCTVDQGFAQEEANRLCAERGHPATAAPVEQNNY